MALVIVSGAVAADFVAIVGDDVAVATGGSGSERGGWGDSRGGLGRPGSVCRRFLGAGARGSCWNSSREVIVVVVDDDAALAVGGFGHKRRGFERCCGDVGRPGRVYHRFRGAGGWFGAGKGMVVVVNDGDGIVDGGCAAVVSGDTAVPRGVSGCMARAW
jgi:hypothetical protein